MTEDQGTYAIVARDESVRLGSLQLSSPADVTARASIIARELASIVDDRKLYSVISGRKFVKVEGWSTMGAMLGILPRETQIVEHENGDFEATVELIRSSDGAVIGRGSAIVGSDEKTWATRPRYARRSMALTRATGKAYRLGFSWIIALAGYEATPAEEMDGVQDASYREEPQPSASATHEHDTNGKTPIYQAVVDAGLSENVHAARKALNSCSTGYDTPEKAIAWMRSYRAWRDSGADSKTAAAHANKGELPK